MSTGLKEALEYVVGLKAPIMQVVNGETYTDRVMQRVRKELKAEPIFTETLTGLIQYIKSGTDEKELAGKMIVHVMSPTRAVLLSSLNGDMERNSLIEANAKLPDIIFNRYMNSEEFMISLRSKFVQNDDTAKLIQFSGTVEAGTIATYSDDGISQSAAVREGIVGKETKLVPNPVILCPYRTFFEVRQPESEFIFRMKNRDNSVACAIFEADGGAWMREAMTGIQIFLQKNLEEYENITVIS